MQKHTVRESKKNQLPPNPPTIVRTCEPEIVVLHICITENISTEEMLLINKLTFVSTAEN